MTFRQRRPTRVHTVLPGREVEATVQYGQCRACQRGSWPVLTELGVDREGVTPALQTRATLASVVEPYETASTDLARYLTTNRERMQYQTFRAAGYAVGSGAVESAVSHVVQQRMKRVGMRWRAAGADAMLALRSIYRSTGAWDRFWSTRRVA